MIDFLFHSNETNVALKVFCDLRNFGLVACHDLLAASGLAFKTALEDSTSIKSLWKLLAVALSLSILGIVDLDSFQFGYYFVYNAI